MSGYVIKCDIIGNLGIKNNILNNEIKDNIESIINKCLYLKKDIVEKDEFETNGLRKVLNLGHTYSLALSSFSCGTIILWTLSFDFMLPAYKS